MRKIACVLILLLAMVTFAEMTIEGSLDGFRNIQAAYEYDGVVYVLSGREMVSVNPSLPDPVELDRIEFDGYTMEVVFEESRAYLLQGNKLTIVNISDPSSLTEVTEFDLSNYGYDLEKQGDYIFVAALDAMDIFQLSSIDDMSRIYSIASTSGQCKSVSFWDDKLLMGTSEAGMSVYDVSVPSSPSMVGNANTPGWVLDIEINDNFAYVADGSIVGVGDGSIVKVDLMTGPMYSMVDTFVSSGGNCFEGVIAMSNYYILADGGSVKILDISTDDMIEIDSYTMATGEVANNVDYDGEYIYVGASTRLFILSSDELIEPADIRPPSVNIIHPIDMSYSGCLGQEIQIELTDETMIDWTRAEFSVDGFVMTGHDIPRSEDVIIYMPMIEWMSGEHTFSLSGVCDTAGNCLHEPITSTFTIDYDTPTLLGTLPDEGRIVRVETPLVQANLTDATGEIDPSSIVFEYVLDGTTYTGTYPDDIAWDGRNATFTTVGPFEDDDEVMMTVRFSDKIDYCDPHENSHSWSFSVVLGGEDVEAPMASIMYPATGAFTSVAAQRVGYEITDISGVDPSSIVLDVNGTNYTVDGTTLSFESDLLTFIPSSNWAEGYENVVTLEAYADMVGNTATMPIETRFTGDYTAPYIAWTFPTPGATDISSTSSIQIAVNEAISGLNTDVIEMTINSVVVTPIFSPVPGDTGKVVTYVPTESYSSSTVEVCLNNVADRVTVGEPNSIDTCFTFYTDAINESLPEQMTLATVAPNPFNSSLAITFDGQGATTIAVYSTDGRHIETLFDGNINGRNTLNWNTSEESGLYLIKIQIGKQLIEKKALLIR